MRLIAHIENESDAKEFSYFLLKEGVANKLELSSSPEEYQLWIIDEEKVSSALEWYEEFKKDSKNPLFRGHQRAALKEVIASGYSKAKSTQAKVVNINKRPSLGKSGLTTFILITCIILFMSRFFIPSSLDKIERSPVPLILSSPVYKHLMYDFPKAYQTLENLLILYNSSELENPDSLPEEGKVLEKKRLNTPYWDGAYDELLLSFQNPDIEITFTAPMFEQIKQGQLWRLFTPCLLHADIFHIFFNMFWLLVLGPPMERNLGKLRFIFFIILVGIISNTGQYLISGPNFLGFSGVIAGMLGFTWMRQKLYPWEDYHTSAGIFLILSIGIFLMFFLQLASFYVEVQGRPPIASGIANTAHIIGLILGGCLGKLKLFTLRHQG